MNARVRLPACSREEIAYRNAIAQAGESLRFSVAGADWTLRLERLPDAATSEPAADWLEADWGGARFGVTAGTGMAGRFLKHVLPGADAVRLPESLRLAAMEVLRAELERALQANGGGKRPLRLNALREPPVAAGARHRYRFQAASAASGEAVRGEIATDVMGLSFAAPVLRALPAGGAPPEPGWLDALPVALRITIGATTLTTAELEGLAVGDLVMLDDSWLAQGNELLVEVAPRLGLRGRVEGRTLTVTQPLGKIMAESTPAATAAPNEGDVLEQLPVRLSFDLGERMVTLAELRALRPGFTFDLGRDLRRPVGIRANGQPIGEGELIDIDGVLGVSVVTLGRRDAAA